MDHYHGYQYELNSNQQLDREGIRRGDLKKKKRSLRYKRMFNSSK